MFHKAGADVTVICRSNFDAVTSDGLTIDSQIWGTKKFKPQLVVRSVAEAAKESGAYDYILVSTKAFPGTAKLIADVVSDNTAIVSISSISIQRFSRLSALT